MQLVRVYLDPRSIRSLNRKIERVRENLRTIIPSLYVSQKDAMNALVATAKAKASVNKRALSTRNLAKSIRSRTTLSHNYLTSSVYFAGEGIQRIRPPARYWYFVEFGAQKTGYEVPGFWVPKDFPIGIQRFVPDTRGRYKRVTRPYVFRGKDPERRFLKAGVYAYSRTLKNPRIPLWDTLSESLRRKLITSMWRSYRTLEEYYQAKAL